MNLGFGDGGNIVKIRLSQFFDLRPPDHAPIPHEGYSSAAKALDDFLDLRSDRFGIAGIADKHLNGQGPALAVAQKADDNLLFARLPIAVVAPGSQGVMVAFQIAAGYVVEEQFRAAFGMILFKEPLFDWDLVFRQPSQIGGRGDLR